MRQALLGPDPGLFMRETTLRQGPASCISPRLSVLRSGTTTVSKMALYCLPLEKKIQWIYFKRINPVFFSLLGAAPYQNLYDWMRATALSLFGAQERSLSHLSPIELSSIL